MKKLYSNGDLDNKIAIHVFGKIHDEDAELINKLGLSKIIIEHGKINYDLLTSYMKGADILYLSQGEDHRDCVPYKLTDYLTIGKPVLAVTSLNSATYNFMEGLDCGIAADIDDQDSIYKALKEILIDKKKFTFEGKEKYSIDNLSENFYKIITNLK